ncbi:TauD/TfdA dioxygenase family protein [Yinghuangia sp. YIM S10712]|uniref:TauD/TfdA dioxygenase family protein n=1 Tax=Yinghuangia sp. YIM S10712 TaxID=3436930 RepID=UPI003F534401
MTVTTAPITPETGIQYTGLHGADLVDPAVARELRTALETHGVVVCREADVDDAELVALSRMLGEVVVAPIGGDTTHPEISAVTLDPTKSDLASYRRSTFYWHIDGTNDAVPQKATLLTAREVAEDGGDTEFANTYAAYDALPDDEKQRIASLRVVHSFKASQLLVTPDPTAKELAAWERVPAREHPLVWTRSTGRKSLLVGATTDHIVGMPADESRALLDHYLDWATQPRFTVRHSWRRGDLVIWDNTGMLHRALPYQPTSRRLMHRTTLIGEEAVA